MKRAVVLGSGGITGGAWQIGVLRGLLAAGIDLSEADLLVGASAGAILGTALRMWRSIEQVYDWRVNLNTSTSVQGRDRSPEDIRYFQECSRLWGKARLDMATRIELGRKALATPNPTPETRQLAIMRDRFHLDAWPNGDLRVVAVDVEDGSVRFFDQSQGVPIDLALAATAAQPGLQAPITIDGRRYMDGGVAGTNIEGAAGCDVVIAVTAFSAAEKSAQEIEMVEAAGGRVVHVWADEKSRAEMGPNLADFSRARPSGEAGILQASTVVESVRALWDAKGPE